MASGCCSPAGASRRLGADKASLVLDGETLARRDGGAAGAGLRPGLEVGPGLTGLPSVTERPRRVGSARRARGRW